MPSGPSPDDLEFAATVRGLSEGQKLFGRYSLVRVLGRGGMGIVWLARDGELDRDVALKFLPEAVQLDAEAIAELKRETKRSLALTHPHIVRIHDFLQSPEAACICMEYVGGPTLAELKVRQPDRCFDVAHIRPWVRDLVDALRYAHEKARVVHRDLKPANLMITEHGDVKITDFGIASSVSDSMSRISMRQSSGGSPPYASPQQLMGEEPSPLDDVYAFGATLYDLLSGKPPFFRGNIFSQVREVVPPSIAQRRSELGNAGAPIPPHWEETIAACLAKDRAARPQSVAQVGELLSQAPTVTVPPVAAVPPAAPIPAISAVASPPPMPAPVRAAVSSAPPPMPQQSTVNAGAAPEKRQSFNLVALISGAVALVVVVGAFVIFKMTHRPPNHPMRRVAERTQAQVPVPETPVAATPTPVPPPVRTPSPLLEAARNSLVEESPSKEFVPLRRDDREAMRATPIPKATPAPVYRPSASLDRLVDVSASSVLAPVTYKGKRMTYEARNAVDGSIATAWVGNTAGPGEMLAFRYDQPVEFRAVKVFGGYGIDVPRWETNHRVKDFELQFPSGVRYRFTCRDTMETQRFELPHLEVANAILFRILTVYRGTKYEATPVSEVSFE